MKLFGDFEMYVSTFKIENEWLYFYADSEGVNYKRIKVSDK